MGFHNIRNKDGRFRSTKPQAVVAGRLYGFRGAVVRAGNDRQNANGGGEPLRHVSFHKLLHGFVPERELKIVTRDAVSTYLQEA